MCTKPSLRIMGLLLAVISLTLTLILLSPTLSITHAQDATSQQGTVNAAVSHLFTETAQAQQGAITETIQAAFNQALTATGAAMATPTSGNDPYANIPSGTTRTGPIASITYPFDVPYLGDPNAPVKIEDISSLSCPPCLNYHQQIFVKLIDEMQAGRLQFLFLPTTLTGDFDAVPGTKAAYCAMQQDKFWPMLDLLFDNQKQYGADAAKPDRIQALASQVGILGGAFQVCFDSPEASQYVQQANDYANTRGLVGTPTIFLYVNGKQVMPSSQSAVTTPGSVADMSLTDLRQIIESGQTPTALSTPTMTPFPTFNKASSTPTLDPSGFDFSTAKLFKSDDDVLEIELPNGWKSVTVPSSTAFTGSSYAFVYGGSELQDAPIGLEIQIGDEKTIYKQFDQTGHANSPTMALQALINLNSTPQPGAPAIAFGKIRPIKIGKLNGQGLTADQAASGQSPEQDFDVRVAQLPPKFAVDTLVAVRFDLLSKAQPVIGKMLDSIVIKPQNMVATSTATPTPGCVGC